MLSILTYNREIMRQFQNQKNSKNRKTISNQYTSESWNDLYSVSDKTNTYATLLNQAKSWGGEGGAQDVGSISGSGRSPGEGYSNPLLYSCLENPMDRGAWQATVHGVAKSGTWLSTHTHTHTHRYGYGYRYRYRHRHKYRYRYILHLFYLLTCQ